MKLFVYRIVIIIKYITLLQILLRVFKKCNIDDCLL